MNKMTALFLYITIMLPSMVVLFCAPQQKARAVAGTIMVFTLIATFVYAFLDWQGLL